MLERINAVRELKRVAQSALAEIVGVPQPTLHRYFKEADETKLAPLLWKIAAAFPDVNRDWLFFGEGEMLGGTARPGLDEELLRLVLETLEDALQKSGKMLPPKAKAEAIAALYQMAAEDRQSAKKPMEVVQRIIESLRLSA